MQRSDPLAPPLPRIDWRQYFLDFCEVHGKVPMELDGKLVFSDGWSYSCNDHRGPEYPPPEEPKELQQLLLRYWHRRRTAVELELRKARIALETAENAVANRSAQLTVYSQIRDPESGRIMVSRAPLNIDDYRGRVEWLEADAKICDDAMRGCILELRLLRMPKGANSELERPHVEQAR